MRRFFRYLASLVAFGYPHFKPYALRFALGVVLAVGYAASNGLIVVASKAIVERMSSASQVEVSTGLPDMGSLSFLEAGGRRLDVFFDTWLPRKGEVPGWQQAVGAVLILALLSAFRGGMAYTSTYCLAWASERGMRDIKCHVLRKLNTLSLGYYHRSSSGDLITRLGDDINNIQKSLTLGLNDLIQEPFTLLVLAGTLVFIDWKLALLAYVLMPLAFIPVVILGRKVKKASARQREAGVSRSSLILQILANVRVVKAFRLEKVQEEDHYVHADQMAKHSIKVAQSRGLINPLIETLSSLSGGLILLAVFYWDYDISDLAAFLFAMALSYSPVKKLANANMLLQQTAPGIERLFELFREKPTVEERPGASVLTEVDQAIVFEDVSFAYGDAPVLKEVSLTIPKGTHLGIVGESGSGKSSLVNLLFRFYDVSGGRILIDGRDVRDLTLDSLRGHLALAGQEVLLFNRSVAENIRFGKLDASDEDVQRAAKLACADRFIGELPEGYGTLVGEWGSRLSGGQRQRLSLARALVRQAPVLVLDEATAALDSETEAGIQENIDNLSRDTTVLIVAHRLSTLQGCDRIIVLDGGRLVQEGTFSQLLGEEGVFRKLAKRQGLVLS